MHNPNITKYRKGFDVVVEHPDTLSEPYTWKKPTTVFVNSMSDLFHKDVSLDFIKKVFKVMNDTPQHTYQVLTKRGKNLEKYSDELTWSDNIWAGVSVGNQVAKKRIQSLVNCGAKHKFLSIEPLLEEITDLNLTGIDWVIVGGESGGNEARPMEKDWVLGVQEQCSDQNVPFFFKQWGKARNNPNPSDPTLNKLHRYYSKGGNQLDGKTYWVNPTMADDSMPTIEMFGEEFLVMDEHNEIITIWELKSHLPFQDEAVYKKLKKDIRKNGLNDPILVINVEDGKSLVIEGHTRLRAMIELKKDYFPMKVIDEDFKSLEDVKLWMVKHQLQRRNLSNVEKIKLAYQSKPTIEKMAKENLSKVGKGNTKTDGKKEAVDIDAIDTHQEIANIAGVGRTSVVRYSQILTHASQAVLKRLDKGDISIGSAHETVKNKIGKKIKPKKKTIAPKVNELLHISTRSEGGQKLISREIDMMVSVLDSKHLRILKGTMGAKIGVMGLDSHMKK